MAVIQKIRDKYAKLAGGLIALALIAFVISSASESNLGNSVKEMLGLKVNYVLKVDGEKIYQKEYTERTNAYDALYEIYAPNRRSDDAGRAQQHDEALRLMVFEKLVNEQMNDLGVTTTKEEENDLIKGAEPDELVKRFPAFANQETQQFDPNILNMLESKKGLDMSNPNVVKIVDQWEMVKSYVKQNHRLQKYNAMIMAGVYMPKYLVNRDLKDQATMANMQYVKVPFTTVNDNEVKVTDAELQDYINKHASQYTIYDPTRSIEYVSYELKPSGADTSKVADDLAKLKTEFTDTKDNASFVGRNSGEPYNDAYIPKKAFMSVYADSILKQPLNTVFGPYFEGDAYKLTKVTEMKMMPDSVKCRHILVKTEEQGQPKLDDATAKKKIDSIENAVKSGADFKALAAATSDDQGSKDKGGEYDFSLAQRSGLSKEFADFIFDGKTGEKKVVKVSNGQYAGYHYIEILGQKNMEPAYKIATVTRKLMTSAETDQGTYAKASQFAGTNNNGKAFDEAVKKENLNKAVAANIKVSDFTIQGIGASREIIRWAYAAKVGDVSGVFKADGRYIVAKLTGTQDKGVQKLDDKNRPQIESIVKAEKKAKLIQAKYKSATSLEGVAQASAQQVATADSFNASNGFIPNVGPAPKVVGYAFSNVLKQNTMSPGIEGGDGVFFINVSNRWQSATPQDPAMAERMMKQNEMNIKNTLSGGVLDMLRKSASITYNGELLY